MKVESMIFKELHSIMLNNSISIPHIRCITITCLTIKIKSLPLRLENLLINLFRDRSEYKLLDLSC